MQLTPLRRGQLRLLGVRLARPDPLGIFKACILTPAPESLMVMPKRYPVAWVDLEGVPINRAGGPTPAATVGDSEEFVALREYRPRDPLRHIHWRSWARLGRPIVKEFQKALTTVLRARSPQPGSVRAALKQKAADAEECLGHGGGQKIEGLRVS